MRLKINDFYNIIKVEIGKEYKRDHVYCKLYLLIGLDLLLWIVAEFLFAYGCILFCGVWHSVLREYDILQDASF